MPTAGNTLVIINSELSCMQPDCDAHGKFGLTLDVTIGLVIDDRYITQWKWDNIFLNVSSSYTNIESIK